MIPRYSRPAMRQIWTEEYTFELWLQVEIAACQAWNREGLIPDSEMELIKQAKFDRQEYDQEFESSKHDLVSFVKAVTKSLGPEARWIHYGLTSNDVKDTALSIQLRDSVKLIIEDLCQLEKELKRQAKELKYAYCMGRSHGIHAEPMSFGLKVALWYDMVNRTRQRFEELSQRVGLCKISGPVGTYSSVPPQIEERVAEILNLKPVRIANQIIQRDIHAEFVQQIALGGAVLEYIATEIRHLQRTELSEVYEPFGKSGYVSKGSSSMPHKRNPELSERICGLARLLRGFAQTGLENVALWHERDISHSSAERTTLPDSAITFDYILGIMTGIVGDMVVDRDRMEANMELSNGAAFSSRLMTELVSRGWTRTKAYDLVQAVAMNAKQENIPFTDMIRRSPEITEMFGQDEIEQLFDYRWYVRHIDTQFERLGIDS